MTITETGIWPALRTAVVAGGAAGAIAVTGIKEGDGLAAVIEYDPDSGGAGVGGMQDLTSEFSISADDEIDNTGGTATTGHDLLVMWFKQSTE